MARKSLFRLQEQWAGAGGGLQNHQCVASRAGLLSASAHAGTKSSAALNYYIGALLRLMKETGVNCLFCGGGSRALALPVWLLFTALFILFPSAGT